MTAVTIPAELAADVAARPETYRPYDGGRPAGEQAVEVLLLDRANAGLWGPVGGWFAVDDDVVSVALRSDTNRAPGADAWALVGSVDGGPRPDVGQRVLVLDHPLDAKMRPDGVRVVQRVTEAPSGWLVAVEGDTAGFWPLVNRWALLPDAAEPCTLTLDEAADLARRTTAAQQARRAAVVAADAAADGSTCSAPDLSGNTEARELPPGALPAAQLHDARQCATPKPGDPEQICRLHEGHDGPHEDPRLGIWDAWPRTGATQGVLDEVAVLLDWVRQNAASAEWRDAALTLLAAGQVPDGEWRVGGNVSRNLYIGPPRPYGVDVGRMDSPELAAFVVEAVNAWHDHPGEVTDVMVERAAAAFMTGPGPVISDMDGMDGAIRAALEAAPVQWRPLSIRENDRLRSELADAVNEVARLREAVAAGLRIADRAFELDEEVRRLRTALRKLAVECTTAGLLPSAVAAARDVLDNPPSAATSATLPAETPESVHDHAHAREAGQDHQRETRYGGVDEEPT